MILARLVHFIATGGHRFIGIVISLGEQTEISMLVVCVAYIL